MAEFDDFDEGELELVTNIRRPSYPRFSMKTVGKSMDTMALFISRYGRENVIKGEPTETPRTDWIGLYVVKAVKDQYE